MANKCTGLAVRMLIVMSLVPPVTRYTAHKTKYATELLNRKSVFPVIKNNAHKSTAPPVTLSGKEKLFAPIVITLMARLGLA